MQISSVNIQELIDKQQLIQNIADARKGERIEASKYDLTVGKIFESSKLPAISEVGITLRRTQEMVVFEPDEQGLWRLTEGIYFLQSSEIVTMPPWLSAFVVSRTTIFRAGCLLSGSIVDPGFSGNVLVRLAIPANYILVLEQCAKVMSLVFNVVGTLHSVSPAEGAEFTLVNSLVANEIYSGIWSGDKVSTQGKVERGS
jgi:deoxycytidine triphosphate deaminase